MGQRQVAEGRSSQGRIIPRPLTRSVPAQTQGGVSSAGAAAADTGTGGTAYNVGKMACKPMRGSMIETLSSNYIRTARAKGAGPWRVLFRHAFRNTLIPLVTLLGLSLPSLVGGSVIIEQIFTWPGMGRLFFESIRERDYPTIMGLTLMFSVLTLLGQLLADLLYCLVDPRVSVA